MAIAYIERFKGIYNGNLLSTSTGTGTLVITGGAGISGNINSSGVLFLSNEASSTSTSTGSLVVTGGVGVSGNINTGGSFSAGSIQNTPIGSTTRNTGAFTTLTSNGATTFTANTTSTSTATGTLVVTGGVGVSGAIRAGSIQNTPIGSTTPSTAAFTTLTANGATTFTANTASTSTATGTLVVTGGVGVSGAINIGGGVDVSGSIHIGENVFTNVLEVDDTAYINFIEGNTAVFYGAADATSIGTGALQVTQGGLSVFGQIRAGSIQNTPIGSTTRNTAAFTTLTANGATTFTANTASTSTATGTLVVTGGVGISGNLNIGGNISANNLNTGGLNTTDLVVAGNLTVEGNTTILNTEVLQVEDHQIEIGKVQTPTDTTANDGGIVLKGATDKKLTWLDATDRWTSNQGFHVDVNTASTSSGTGALLVGGGMGIGGNINAGGTVNRLTGNTASTSTATGTLVVTGGVGVSGTINTDSLKSNGIATDELSVSGLFECEGLNAGGIVSAYSATASTSTTTGALLVGGGMGIGGNINAGGTVNRLTGNTASTSTATGTLVVTGGVGVSGNINAGGEVRANDLRSNNLSVDQECFISGTLELNSDNGSLYLDSTIASTSTSTGAIKVPNGGVGIGGNINVGGTVNRLTGNTASTSTATGTLVVTGGVGIGGNLNVQQNASFSGTISASFAWLDSINTDEGNITCGPIYCNSIFVANNTASTSTNTGALVVNGGIGLAGNINAGGTVNRLTGNTASTSTATGTLVVTGGVGVSGRLSAENLKAEGATLSMLSVTDEAYINYIEGNTAAFSGTVVFYGAADATSIGTGALQVTQGGLSVFGQIRAGSIQNTPIGSTTRNTGAFTTLTSNGATTFTANTASTSTATGTLVVTGGVGVSGNLNVGGSFSAGNLNANDMVVAGNLTVNGNTTILNTETVRVEDHNIELGSVTTPTDATANGGGITLKGTTDKTLTWISSTNAWTSNQNFRVITNTASTSSNSGTLVVTGGVGVSGNINASGSSHKLQGRIIVGDSSTVWPFGNSAQIESGSGEDGDPSMVTAEVVKTGFIEGPNGNTTFEINNTYGGTILYDNLSIRQKLTVWLNSELRGNVSIESSTASISNTSGALLVSGGTGILGNINIGGTVNTLTGNTASTSTATGTLVVTGGVGVSGAINAGSIQNTPIGNTTRNTGAFTTLTSNGATTFTANTASTSTATGTLVVTGGVGVSGNINVGQNVKISGNTQSTSTTSGALVVTGGVGVGGDFWIGGNVFVDNNKVFEAATIVVTSLNVFNSDISGNVTIGDTLNVNKLNPGVTLAAGATPSPKVSIKVPVDFKTISDTSIFTVPVNSMFLIDSMEVLTTEISSPGTAPTVRLGNTGEYNAYYGPTQVTSNSLGSRHIIENPQDGVSAGVTVTCGITVASTASVHSGFIKVTGELIKLSSIEDC